LSRLEHVRKIRDRKKRADIGKYSVVRVNRAINNWNQLPAEELGTSLVILIFLEIELEKKL